MVKVIYIICGIAVFFAISIGIYIVSDHYASQMEMSLVKEATLRDLKGNSWKVSHLNENVGVVYFGYTYFGDNDSTAMITSNFTPLDVEVKTSQGKINGTISLPDTIMTLGLSETSNLPLSTPFTISWAGSNADFYYVSFDYEYKDENDNWQYEYFDEMTSDNSFTFPGSIFSYNGEIEYISIQPINGSVPQEGAEGNMSGDGSGFLYYWVNTFNYEGDNIIVGSGSSGRILNTSTFYPNEQELKQRIRKKIENRILGIEEK